MKNKSKKRPTREKFKERCERMYAELTGKISSGDLHSGDLLPSELKLAGYYSLSRESVRKILSQIEEQGLITRIQGKGIIVGQVASGKQKNISIGILPPSFEDGKIPEKTHGLEKPDFRAGVILDTVETALLESGVKVSMLPSRLSSSKDVSDILDKAIAEKNNGLIIIYRAEKNLVDDLVEKAKELRIVSVIASSYIKDSPSAGIVCFDNVQIGRLAAEHLIDLGHKRAAFIGDMNFPWAKERFAGFKSVFESCGIKFDKKLILDEDAKLRGASRDISWRQLGQHGARQLFKNKDFSAIFCANDAIAAGVYDVAMEKGIKIPEDLSVIGCDNDYNYSALGLTTQKVNCVKTGQAAAEMLIGHLTGNSFRRWPARVEIAPTLIEKTSVSCVGKSTIKKEAAIA